METRKGTIKRETDKTALILKGLTEDYEIILTEDKPNNVKHVFSTFILELIAFLLQKNKAVSFYL